MDEPEQMEQIEAPEALEPEVLSLAEDALIQLEGMDEPVRFGDFQADHIPKSEFTKLRQADKAELQKQVAAVQQQYAQQAQQYQQQLQQYMYQQQQRQQPQGDDPVSQLWSEVADAGGYPTVQHMRRFYELANQQAFMPLAQQNQQILQALQLFYQDYVNTKSQLASIRETNAGTTVENMVAAVMREMEVPDRVVPEVKEALLDLYHSYEGDDLNDSFPELAKTRIQQMRKWARALDKAEKKRASGAPSGGGSPVPTGKRKVPQTDEDMQAMIDASWDRIQGGSET